MQETIAIRQVSPSQAKSAIRSALRVHRPTFVWGTPGCGKSDIIRQIGAEENREVIDIRMATKEPTDICGIPYFNPLTNKMSWAIPSVFPTDPNSNAIIFMDELNSAPPAVQASAYELILDRRVGEYVLPKNVDVVAAGNGDSDRGVTYKMASPLANRLVHLEMVSSHTDWEQWAIENRIHPAVIGYLTVFKSDLDGFKDYIKSGGATKAFNTPRSWSYVSDFLYDSDTYKTSDSELLTLISGSIGQGLAIKFMASRAISNDLPKASDILDGKVKKANVKDVSAQYALSLALCFELADRMHNKEKNLNDMIDAYLAFLLNNFSTEVGVMSSRAALQTHKIPLNQRSLPSFADFHKKYGRFVIASME